MIGTLNKNLRRYLLDYYKRSKRRSADISLDHCLKVARTTIKNTRYCFLISAGLNSWSSARLVEPIIESDFSTILIGTNPNLRKIREIQDNPKTTLAFGNLKDKANIVIYGKAKVETDLTLRKKYWKGEWRLFFPDGPAGEDYVLIRINPLRMEMMSFRRNVIQEPFGLKPIVLLYQNNKWTVDSASV